MPKPKIENDPTDTIFAWWRDQPLGDHKLRAEMNAFDSLPADVREATNRCRLNLLPSTVKRSLRLWGHCATLEAIRGLE